MTSQTVNFLRGARLLIQTGAQYGMRTTGPRAVETRIAREALDAQTRLNTNPLAARNLVIPNRAPTIARLIEEARIAPVLISPVDTYVNESEPPIWDREESIEQLLVNAPRDLNIPGCVPTYHEMIASGARYIATLPFRPIAFIAQKVSQAGSALLQMIRCRGQTLSEL